MILSAHGEMKKSKRLVRVFAGGIILASISLSCSAEREDASRFEGRLLFTLVSREHHVMLELKRDHQRTLVIRELVPDITIYEHCISPDGRFAIGGENNVLINLETGQTRTFLQGKPILIQWAPDSKKFCCVFSRNDGARPSETPGFVTGGKHLVIFSVEDGSIRRVHQGDHANYHSVTEPRETMVLEGDISNCIWLGNNKLYFERFVGPFPQWYQKDYVGPSEQVIAYLDDKMTIKKAPAILDYFKNLDRSLRDYLSRRAVKLRVQDYRQDGSRALLVALEERDVGQHPTSSTRLEVTRSFLATDLDDPNKAELRELPQCGDERAQAGNKAWFFTASGSKLLRPGKDHFCFADAASLEVEELSLPAAVSASFDRLYTAFSPDGEFMLRLGFQYSQLVELRTGKVTRVDIEKRMPSNMKDGSVFPFAWVTAMDGPGSLRQ